MEMKMTPLTEKLMWNIMEKTSLLMTRANVYLLKIDIYR